MKWKLVLAISLLFSTGLSAKTLFKYKDKKVEPKLASSFTKVEDNKYKLEIDTKKTVQGKPITIEFVKQSLEGKLKKKLKLAVDKIDQKSAFVTFEGSEETFLKRVSKTRIKARKSVSLALDTSVSDGGIRAKTGKDPADDDEIKVRILKVSGFEVEGIVVGVGKDLKKSFKMGRKVKLLSQEAKEFKKGSIQFLSPEQRWVIP